MAVPNLTVPILPGLALIKESPGKFVWSPSSDTTGALLPSEIGYELQLSADNGATWGASVSAPAGAPTIEVNLLSYFGVEADANYFNALCRYRVRAKAAAVAKNLLTNPSFEDAATGWLESGAASMTIVADPAAGSNAAKVAKTSASEGYIRQSVPIFEGHRYYTRGMCKRVSGTAGYLKLVPVTGILTGISLGFTGTAYAMRSAISGVATSPGFGQLQIATEGAPSEVRADALMYIDVNELPVTVRGWTVAAIKTWLDGLPYFDTQYDALSGWATSAPFAIDFREALIANVLYDAFLWRVPDSDFGSSFTRKTISKARVRGKGGTCGITPVADGVNAPRVEIELPEAPDVVDAYVYARGVMIGFVIDNGEMVNEGYDPIEIFDIEVLYDKDVV